MFISDKQHLHLNIGCCRHGFSEYIITVPRKRCHGSINTQLSVHLNNIKLPSSDKKGIYWVANEELESESFENISLVL